MNKEDARKKELSAMLALIYSQGIKQPQLFSIKESKENKEAINFRKLIDKEAKRRNVNHLELLDYLAEHREELLQLLRRKKVSFAEFKKIYEHADMEKIKSKILKPGRLEKIGIKNMNEDYIIGEVEVWKSKDVEYYVKIEDMIKLKGNPKVSVSQLKNISVLMALTQEQQFNNEIKEAKCEFALSYYAKRRGYTKEEIQRSGIIFNELKRDLFTGAYTAYGINHKEIINGNEYIRHGIRSFYDLLEPIKDHSGINWIVRWNELPWKEWIIELLEGRAKQFFIEDRKAIEDRYTTQNPYLFLFYMQLTKRKRNNLLTQPIKVINLFKDMKLPDDILERPKECFNLLKECLIYFSEHYEPVPEIEQFYLYNDFHKTQTVKLPLNITEAFKQYPYEDFKDLLIAIGIKDIREAYISFKRPHIKKEKSKLSEDEYKLIERIISWAYNNWSIKKDKSEVYNYLVRFIGKKGYDFSKSLFEKEANKQSPNAIDFLFKVLPAEMKRAVDNGD